MAGPSARGVGALRDMTALPCVEAPWKGKRLGGNQVRVLPQRPWKKAPERESPTPSPHRGPCQASRSALPSAPLCAAEHTPTQQARFFQARPACQAHTLPARGIPSRGLPSRSGVAGQAQVAQSGDGPTIGRAGRRFGRPIVERGGPAGQTQTGAPAEAKPSLAPREAEGEPPGTPQGRGHGPPRAGPEDGSARGKGVAAWGVLEDELDGAAFQLPILAAAPGPVPGSGSASNLATRSGLPQEPTGGLAFDFLSSESLGGGSQGSTVKKGPEGDGPGAVQGERLIPERWQPLQQAMQKSKKERKQERMEAERQAGQERRERRKAYQLQRQQARGLLAVTAATGAGQGEEAQGVEGGLEDEYEEDSEAEEDEFEENESEESEEEGWVGAEHEQRVALPPQAVERSSQAVESSSPWESLVEVGMPRLTLQEAFKQ